MSNRREAIEHNNLNSRKAIFRIGLFTLILMLVSLPQPLGAQQDAGSLRVLVEDASGATVPAATVMVTNVSTNTSTERSSSTEGQAVFSPLPRGTYTVEVEMLGFNTVRISDVIIDVNQNRLVRAGLEVAQVTETVEVRAEVAAIQTEDASLGQVVRGRVIVELPLAARRYTDLTLLVPGATESTLNANSRGPGWLVVNGNNHTQNNFILDGFDNNQNTTNLQSRSAQIVQPSPDTLSEFKVMTNNFSAEFGRAAGAVVNASIRSGGNDTHGSAWWYNRAAKLAANSWRGNLLGTPRDELSWNQLGGTIGGRIVENKLFYFADYEGFFSDTSELQIDDIPTTAFRSGDFSGLTNPIFDPATGGSIPFANNQLPSSRIDLLGKKIVDLYPSPNLPGRISSSSGRPSDNHGVQLPISNDVHKYDVRIDYYATTNDRFFSRYSFNDANLFKQPTFPDPADTGSGDGGSQLARNQSLATSWNRVISPTSVNEFRFGYNRTTSSFVHATVGGVTGTEFGFLGIPPSLDEVGGLPLIVMSSYHNLGTGGWRPQFQDPDAYQINDTFSMTKGAHSMKMGFDFRHKNNEWVDLQYRTTRFSFGREYTDDDAADLLLGLPTDVRGQTFMLAEQIQQNYSLYFQDDWKVTPQLTLNLGLRYEYVTPFWGRSPNTNVNFDLETGQLIIAPGGQPLLFGAREASNKFVQDQDFNNFGPRFGVAYRLNDGLVLRGGYGVFYSGEDFHGSGGNLLINGPNTLPITLQRRGDGPAPVTLSTPIPSDFLDPASVKTENLGFQFRNPDIEASTVQQWNAALQFLLTNESTFEIAYVGNKVANQEATIRANRAPYGVDGSIAANRFYPKLGNVELLEAIAQSQYHALQAKFEHRFSEGWYNLTSYTYASGTAESGGFAAGNRTQVNLIVNGVPTGDRRRERAFHRQLTRQRLSMANIWQIPYGRGKKWGTDMNRALNAIVGGWQFNTIITGKSGLPVDIRMSDRGVDPITGQSFRYFRNSGGGRLRPNRVGDPNTGISPKDDRFRFLDVNAFERQPLNTPGNAARNTAWGPTFWNFDIGINKRFQVTETVHADFRFEMFNTFNHTNFRAPASDWSRSGFGRINDAFAPRQMQWALRIGF
jgi:hypothetical protein